MAFANVPEAERQLKVYLLDRRCPTASLSAASVSRAPATSGTTGASQSRNAIRFHETCRRARNRGGKIRLCVSPPESGGREPRTGGRAQRKGVRSPRTGVLLLREGVRLSRTGVLLLREGVRVFKAGVLVQPAGVRLSRTGVLLLRKGALLLREGVRVFKAGVLVQPAGVRLSRTGVLLLGKGVRLSRTGVLHRRAALRKKKTGVLHRRAALRKKKTGVPRKKAARSTPGTGRSSPCRCSCSSRLRRGEGVAVGPHPPDPVGSGVLCLREAVFCGARQERVAELSDRRDPHGVVSRCAIPRGRDEDEAASTTKPAEPAGAIPRKALRSSPPMARSPRPARA
jgi:hypothetical protein